MADPAPNPALAVDVCIIGSGFSGLGMGARLKQEGKRSFVILEKAQSVGGTWRENTYPGCACDISSHLYSFSFAPKPDWSRMFPTQPEIRAYLEDCATRLGLRPHLRFGAEVTQAAFDDAAKVWRVTTRDGAIVTARALVSGMGGLHKPLFPDLPGLATFAGPAFHSAEWRHDVDLAGKRVAVIGTGASAIQFVPQIQPKVAKLTLFQRTPPWILPKRDAPMPAWAQSLFRSMPATQNALRFWVWARNELLGLGFVRAHADRPHLGEKIARQHLEAQTPDPDLRARLTPDYRLGCKRALISNDYYPAVSQPNVTLVTHGISRIVPEGIITTDGVLHEADVLIFGTGFKAMDVLNPVVITGSGGRVLNEDWRTHPEAFLGVTVTGYPNLFLLMGPNTGLGHNSMIFMIESQIAYVLAALKLLDERGAGAMDVKPAAQRAFNTEIGARLASTIWATGCKSWYLGADGKNAAIWPGLTYEYRRRTAHVNADDYEFV